MNQIHDRRIEHPSAWTSAEIGGKEGLIHRMAPEHAAALWALVDRTRHLAPDGRHPPGFRPSLVNDLMTAVRHEIMRGKGAVVLAGLDMAGVSVEDYSRLYWGLGTHLGVGAPQSYRKDKIGYVQKEENNPTGRGYLMDVELRSHTDFHEILSLASYRKSAEGGMSGAVSSLAIHNVILEEHPEHLKALYEGFFHEDGRDQGGLRGEGAGVQQRRRPGELLLPRPVQIAAAKQLGVDLPADLAAAQKFFSEGGPAAGSPRRLHAGARRDAVLAQLHRPALAHRLQRHARPGSASCCGYG